MPKKYSIYDAKAKLSALVRQVREGSTFVITVHGEPVAELRPISASEQEESLEERFHRLVAEGIIIPAKRRRGDPGRLPIGEHIPGALQRFLDERE
jgi:prevent-host-death family protein